MSFPGGSDSKESACQCTRPGFDAWVGKISWRREWIPTPVFLLENPMDRGAWQAGVTKSWTTKHTHMSGCQVDYKLFADMNFPLLVHTCILNVWNQAFTRQIFNK